MRSPAADRSAIVERRHRACDRCGGRRDEEGRRHDRWARGRRQVEVAKLLARRLGYRLLDTGAIYRAVALDGAAARRRRGPTRRRARDVARDARHPVRLRRRRRTTCYVGGEDVTARDPHAGDLAGRVAGVGASRGPRGAARAAAPARRRRRRRRRGPRHRHGRVPDGGREVLPDRERGGARAAPGRRARGGRDGGRLRRSPCARSGSAISATPAATSRRWCRPRTRSSSTARRKPSKRLWIRSPAQVEARAALTQMPIGGAAIAEPAPAERRISSSRLTKPVRERYQLAPAPRTALAVKSSLGGCRRSACIW